MAIVPFLLLGPFSPFECPRHIDLLLLFFALAVWFSDFLLSFLCELFLPEKCERLPPSREWSLLAVTPFRKLTHDTRPGYLEEIVCFGHILSALGDAGWP